MKSKENADRQQTGMFQQDLELLLDPREGLVKLARRIPWEVFEEAFSGYYSEVGRPAKPVRQMVGLLLLKQLKNLSDERVCEEWRQNPYFQYFCRERFFQWGFPCDPSELVHSRKRIGEEGVEKIFTVSVELHRDKIEKEDELVLCNRGRFTTADFFQNCVDPLGPVERFGMRVIVYDVIADGLDEVAHA
jgi:IS5 family transposase